jgi:hypothetical protein
MKHIIFLICLLFSLNVFSQKQELGNITTELELAPLGTEPLKIGSLRARYFNTASTAFRLSIYLGGSSTTTNSVGINYDQLGNPDSVDLKSKSSNMDFILRPGYEIHLAGTEKLSPYIGGEAYFGIKSTKSKDELNWNDNGNYKIMTTTTKQKTPTFGINLLAGADYYITDKVYLGVEFGYGFLSEGLGKTTVEYENPSSGQKNTEEKGNTRTFNWGPNYQGTIRIGFCIK